MSYIYSMIKDPGTLPSQSLIATNEIKLMQMKRTTTDKDKLNYKSDFKGLVQANALEVKERVNRRSLIDCIPQQSTDFDVNNYLNSKEAQIRDSQANKFELFAELEKTIRLQEMLSETGFDDDDDDDYDDNDDDNKNKNKDEHPETKMLKPPKADKIFNSTKSLPPPHSNSKHKVKNEPLKVKKFIVPKITEIFHQFYAIQPNKYITQSQFIIIFQLIFKNEIFSSLDYETESKRVGNKNLVLLRKIFNIIDLDGNNQINWRHFLYLFFLYLYDGNIDTYKKDLKLLNFNSKNNVPSENIYLKNKYYKYLGIENPNKSTKTSLLAHFLSESNGHSSNVLKDNNLDEELFYFFLIGFAIFSSTSDILNINEKIKVIDMQELILIPLKNSVKNEVKNAFFQEWSAYYERVFSCSDEEFDESKGKKFYTDDFFFLEEYEVSVETFYDFMLSSSYFSKFFRYIDDFQLVKKKKRKDKEKDLKNKKQLSLIPLSTRPITFSIKYNKLLNFYMKNYFQMNLQDLLIKKKLKFVNNTVMKKKLMNKSSSTRLIYYFTRLKLLYKKKKFLKRIMIKNILKRFYAILLLKFYHWKHSVIKIKQGTVIQRYLRKYQINLKYNYFYQGVFLRAVLMIQKHVRRYLTRKMYLAKKFKYDNSILTIHKFFFRYYFSKKKLRNLVLNTYHEKLFQLKQKKINYEKKVESIACHKLQSFFLKLVFKRKVREKTHLKMLLKNYEERIKEFHRTNLINEKIFKDKIISFYNDLKEKQEDSLRNNLKNKKEMKKLLRLKFNNDKKERQKKFLEIEKKNEEKKQIVIEDFINTWNIKIENTIKLYSNFLYNCVNNVSTAAASSTTVFPSNYIGDSHSSLPTAPTSMLASYSSNLTPDEKEMQKKIETIASKNVKAILREADRNHIPMEIPEAYQISLKESIDKLLQEKREALLKEMKAEGELIEKREAAKLKLIKKNEEINRQRNKVNYVIKIQNFVRTSLSYKKLTSLCYKFYRKIFDRHNFSYFYLNTKTRNILYKKPYGLGEFNDIDIDNSWDLMLCRNHEFQSQYEEEKRIKDEFKKLKLDNNIEKDDIVEEVEKKEWHGEGEPSTVVLSVESNYTEPLVYYLQPSTWTASFSQPPSLLLCSMCSISISDIYFSELALLRLSSLFKISYNEINLQANQHYCKYCFFNAIEHVRSIGDEFISPLEIQFQLYPGAFDQNYQLDYFLLPWQNWEYFVNNWNTPWELFQNKVEEYMIHIKKRINELQQSQSNCEVCGFALGSILCSGCNKLYCKKCLKKKHLYLEDEKNKVDYRSYFNDGDSPSNKQNNLFNSIGKENQASLEYVIDLPHDFIHIKRNFVVSKDEDADDDRSTHSSSSSKRKKKKKSEKKRPSTSESLPAISSGNSNLSSSTPNNPSNVPVLPVIK